eukprot:9866432-Ditylum_brightwellii.AAC.1
MACTAPSILASMPANSCRFEHASLVSTPVALITSFAISQQKILPIPTGWVPGHLSSAIRQHAISAQYAAHGSLPLDSQSAHTAISTLNCLDAIPKRRSQFFR